MELLRSRLNQQKNDFMKGKFYIFLMHADRNHLMLMLTLRPSQDSVIPVLISGGAVEQEHVMTNKCVVDQIREDEDC